jgi:DNA-binding transcriptional LysR family regulator
MQWSERTGERIKLRNLHVLMAVAERGSMTAAADQLAISVPVVSKTIADMEHTLGVRLLDRSPRGITPTLYGRALLDCSVAVFDALRQGIQQIRLLADPTAGELAIGAVEPLMAGLVSAVIDRIATKYPRIVFHAVQGDIATLHRLLRERKVDLIVARGLNPNVDEDLHAEALFEEQLFVVAGLKNPWVKKRKIELAELVAESWIIPPPDTVVGSLVVEAFRSAGLEVPKARVVSLSLPLRNSLLATGNFLSMVAGSMLDLSSQRLPAKVLPIDLTVQSRPVEIIRLKDRTLSPVAHLFIEHSRAVASQVKKRSKLRRA